MFKVNKLESKKKALEYYREEYSREEYYAQSQNDPVKPEWQGQLLEDLPVKPNDFNKDIFLKLLDGCDLDGKRLIELGNRGELGNEKIMHVPAYDLTFSPPKSVSIAALVFDDERVVQAHREAVSFAMDHVQKLSAAKVNQGSKRLTVKTNKLLAVKFTHDTSRELDPQLHTHAVVFNMTMRDGKWRALENRFIVESQRYINALYENHLASSLKRVGYGIESFRGMNWEIQGHGRKAILEFSKRRQEILEVKEKLGVTSVKGVDTIALKTRKAKIRDFDKILEKAKWVKLADELNLSADNMFSKQLEEHVSEENLESTIVHALKLNSEKCSVFDIKDLYISAIEQSVGKFSLDEIVSKSQEMIRSRKIGKISEMQLVYDPHIKVLEKEMLQMLYRGMHTQKAIYNAGEVDFNKFLEDPSTQLYPDQYSVVEHVLTSRDRFIGVEGKAGTGKTFTLGPVKAAACAQGYLPRGFAPTNRASVLLSDAGIKSETVSKFIHSAPSFKTQKELWIVDEAGMLSTKLAHELMVRAEEQDAKVVFLGDNRQHAAVEAGQPFRLLASSEMHVKSLTSIVRQKNPQLKKAVELASKGKMREALGHLFDLDEQLGTDKENRFIVEKKTANARIKSVVKDYVQDPKDCLVICPSNRERRKINEQCRLELKKQGILRQSEKMISVLLSKNFSDQEMKFAQNYEIGDVLRYRKGKKDRSVARGSYSEVLAVDKKHNLITVKTEKGQELSYDPSRLKADIYEKQRMAISEGEQVQFRLSDKLVGFNNGDLAKVTKIEQNRMILSFQKNGKKREKRFDLSRPLHLEYGYACTSYSSQGQTFRKVISVVNTQDSRQLVNKPQAYVTMSRPKDVLKIFTDDRAKLALAVNRDLKKLNVLDFNLEAHR